MRLREIQALLHANVPKLSEYSTEGAKTVDQNAAIQISNLSKYRDAVVTLRQVPALRPHVDPVLRLDLMTDTRDKFTIPQGHAPEYTGTMNALTAAAQQLQALVDQTVDVEDPTRTFAVAIPERTSLAQLSEITALLDDLFGKMVGLPVGDADEKIEPFELRGFDVGTDWLVVTTKSVSALIFIGWYVRGLVSLADWWRRRSAEVEAMRLMNEDTKSVVEMNKKMRVVEARRLASGIKVKAAPKANNEEVSRIAALLTQGEALLERRVGIMASLSAPSAVAGAFPPHDAPSVNPLDALLEAAKSAGPLLTEGDGGGQKNGSAGGGGPTQP